MTVVRIRPGPVFGTVRAPPSKSYTHRALVVGHLAHRSFLVRRPLDSEDTRATAAALGRLGTPVVRGSDAWRVGRPAGPGPRTRVAVNCHESGTTLRFVSALASLSDRPVVLTGTERLSERPIDELLSALGRLGVRCRHLRRRRLPIEVRGPMHGGAVSLDASQSSQFVSALLFALPTLERDSSVHLRGALVSEPYVEATMAMLAHHGVRVDRRGRRFRVPGRQRYRGSRFTVPGDASSAAYLWAAAALGGGTVRVTGLPKRWPQADLAVLDLLQATGASVVRRADGATVTAGPRKPFRFDLTDCPDLYPLAGVLAATAPGTSRVLGAEHVVFKESDRKSGTVELARRLGARVTVGRSGLAVEGGRRPRSISLANSTDHRIVMSAAVGALAADRPSRVGVAEAVRKSFPGFWDTLAVLTKGRQRW